MGDGAVILEKDVRDSDIPSQVVIILDVPDAQAMQEVMAHKGFAQFYKGNINAQEHVVKLIMHQSPAEILSNAKYQQWVSLFGENAEHLVYLQDTNGGIVKCDAGTFKQINEEFSKRFDNQALIAHYFPKFCQVSSAPRFFEAQEPDAQPSSYLPFHRVHAAKPYHEFILYPLQSQEYKLMQLVSKESAAKKKNLQVSEKFTALFEAYQKQFKHAQDA